MVGMARKSNLDRLRSLAHRINHVTRGRARRSNICLASVIARKLSDAELDTFESEQLAACDNPNAVHWFDGLTV
jgi:hypothetical protein